MSKLGWWKTILLLSVIFAAWAISLPAQTFTTLVSFNGTDGSFPLGSLVQGFDGNFYGTTSQGGANTNTFFCDDGCGTVFKVTQGGTLTTLYNFCAETNCADGDLPGAGLAQGTDGNLYGTTSYGGANDISACPLGLYIAGCGTVFRITPSGKLTTLHSFDFADGFYPVGALVQASDGNFYGTTEKGGNPDCPHGCGTVFKITPAGTFTTLHSFDGTDGFGPAGTLVEGTDGNLYGTTVNGGASSECPAISGCGTAFELTLEGTLTTIYNFCSQVNCTDGMNPYAGLVQGTDGNFYGTTGQGGSTAPSECSSGCGTVFKITPVGKLTTLHSFDYADGVNPMGALVQATDGNFYGTTNGIYDNYGTLFQITPGGTLKTLHSFQYGYNTNPQAALIQATNGTLYGTTSQTYMTGAAWGGTVFSLSMGLGPFVETLPTSGKAGTTVIILGNNLTGATSVTFNGTPASFTVVSSTEIEATVPRGATTGKVEVVTPSGTLFSNVVFGTGVPLADSATGNVSFSGSLKADLAVWRPDTATWYVHPESGATFSQLQGEPGDIPAVGDYDGDGKSDYALWRPSNGTFYVVLSSTGQAVTQQWGAPGDVPVPGDYDGDGKTDYAVWRPSNGTWYILPSGGGPEIIKQWGSPGDIPVVGDYDGDGKADYAVFRPSNATWYVVLSSTGATVTTQWGSPGDIPLAGDYDGDGKTDYAIWRPSTGTWWIILSSTGKTTSQAWGTLGDIPVVGDYNGDGKNDYAVFRPSNGTWYIDYSSGGSETVSWGETGDIPATHLPSMYRQDKHISNFDGDRKADIGIFRPSTATWWVIDSSTGKGTSQAFGENGDIIVPGDYDGDGKTDYAVWRPSNQTWYVMLSSTGKTITQALGASGDIPVPGDYDGDGKTDYAVFRPSTGTWYVILSSTGQQVSQQYGTNGDIPVPADYDGDGKTDYAVFRPSTATWYVIFSSTGTSTHQQFGATGDIPVPGDYDGDTKADYTVFRPSNGTWYTLQSSTGKTVSTSYGENGDIPVAKDYDGDEKTDIAVFRPSTGTWYILQSSNGKSTQTIWGVSTDVPVNEPTGQ